MLELRSGHRGNERYLSLCVCVCLDKQTLPRSSFVPQFSQMKNFLANFQIWSTMVSAQKSSPCVYSQNFFELHEGSCKRTESLMMHLKLENLGSTDHCVLTMVCVHDKKLLKADKET